MAVKIQHVNHDSLCGKKGITAGYVLLSVNGHDINDVLDYRFYANSRRINVVFETPEGETVTQRFKTAQNVDELGLEFDSYLMDKQHSCKNKCF